MRSRKPEYTNNLSLSKLHQRGKLRALEPKAREESKLISKSVGSQKASFNKSLLPAPELIPQSLPFPFPHPRVPAPRPRLGAARPAEGTLYLP